MTRAAPGALAMLLILGSCMPDSLRAYRDRERAEADRLAVIEASPPGDEQALVALEHLVRDATIPTLRARAAVRAGDRHRDAGRTARAARWWRLATLLDPHGGWARAAVERLERVWRSLGPAEAEARLQGLRHPSLDGMLLYLAAARHAESPEGRARAVELCLRQRHMTPRSPYRDDCEDLVLRLLGPEDRVQFAEELLLPLPSDDPAAMDSPRFQRIELDLARDLHALGRIDAARRHLRRVVDRYPSARDKDDALRLLAQSYREDGNTGAERRTLRTLIENLPESRFRGEAEARLEELSGRSRGTETDDIVIPSESEGPQA